MALVIRTLYNNKDWMEPCKQPFLDDLCYYCTKRKSELNITPPKPGDPICSGSCWERTLCKEHYWGCTPFGNRWGQDAQPGMKVFFVYRQPSRPILYTLWAKTTVESIVGRLDRSGQYGKDGYDLMYFTDFRPTAKNRWKENLTAYEIVGAPWGSGNYRYVGNEIEAALDKLI